MTSNQFCEAAGLSYAELINWLNAGLLAADRVGLADARCREFAPDQLERARVLKLLHDKGVRLSQLGHSQVNLAGRFLIFDGVGESLQTCGDAEAAIRAVVAGKRWCCAVEIPRL
jgi:hypothetical protein